MTCNLIQLSTTTYGDSILSERCSDNLSLGLIAPLVLCRQSPFVTPQNTLLSHYQTVHLVPMQTSVQHTGGPSRNWSVHREARPVNAKDISSPLHHAPQLVELVLALSVKINRFCPAAASKQSIVHLSNSDAIHVCSSAPRRPGLPGYHSCANGQRPYHHPRAQRGSLAPSAPYS